MLKPIKLSNTPTKIYKLTKLSNEYNTNLYIKRDDQTGTEVSGNKIRKLEYSIAEAIQQGCDTLITCGGLQSNHCRATAAAALMQGLKSVLVLRTDEVPAESDGNYFLDQMLNAEIKFISRLEYSSSRQQIMEQIVLNLAKEGRKGYIIPEGASNGVGSLGYINAIQEIANQEQELNINFDTIVCTIGSGGTYAGLCLGNKLFNLNKNIIGFNICDSAQYFHENIKHIIAESQTFLEKNITVNDDDIKIIDGYVGLGYAINQPHEMQFIQEIAKKEAIILDPVYTGKAMLGLLSELKKQHPLLVNAKNILFIHTGGLFGIFPKKNEFKFK